MKKCLLTDTKTQEVVNEFKTKFLTGKDVEKWLYYFDGSLRNVKNYMGSEAELQKYLNDYAKLKVEPKLQKVLTPSSKETTQGGIKNNLKKLISEHNFPKWHELTSQELKSYQHLLDVLMEKNIFHQTSLLLQVLWQCNIRICLWFVGYSTTRKVFVED